MNMRPRANDKERAAARGSGNDAQRLPVALNVAGNGWVRADIANIDVIGKKRCNLCRASIENYRLELDLRSQRLLEGPSLHTDQRHCMRQIGEIGQAHDISTVRRTLAAASERQSGCGDDK